MKAQRPKAVCCYICGREFGTASIEIHLKSCKKKWEIEQSAKPAKERKPVPEPPKNFDDILTGNVDQSKLESYNAEAFTNWNEKVLEACPNCARTFLPDRLVVHLKSCKGSGKAGGNQLSASPQLGGGKLSQSMKPGTGSGLSQSTNFSSSTGGLSGTGAGIGQKGSASPSKTIVKPKTLVCYICGREFGSSSLEIHLKTCKKKWEVEQSQKPPGERKPLPEPPKNFDDMITGKISGQEIESYNDDALKSYNDKALDACPNCGRTFIPDRLIVHLRSCNKAHGKSPEQIPSKGGFSKGGQGGGLSGTGAGIGQGGNALSKSQSSPQKTITKPKTLVCYICGREFGSSSLEIHIKSCKKKWEIEQSLKPKHERKPVPEPPKNFDDMIAGNVSTQDMSSYNDDALKSYNDKALDACPNCGRTFIPDRLIVHLRSCNKAHGRTESSPQPRGSPQMGGGKIGGPGSAGMGSPQKQPAVIVRPKTIMCYICGREYGTASIEIHLKNCRQKWETEEEKKPAKQRRPLPQPPSNFEDMVIGVKSGNGVDLEAYNNEAFKQYNEVALMACHNCGRTFLPDRLEVHLKSCDKAHSGGKKKDEPYEQILAGGKQGNALSTPDLRNKPIKGQESSTCNLCGRTFSPSIMEQHLKSCQKRWSGDKLGNQH